MNERIRELAIQAIANVRFWNAEKESYDVDHDELEKFAELIVKECADVLIAEMIRLNSIDRVVASQTMDTAQVLIKQHFGVK